MIRKTCQRRFRSRAVAALGQNYAQYLGTFYRVLPERLVKIPYAEKQRGIRVFGFYRIVLRHERRLGKLLCHIVFFSLQFFHLRI